jgi:hypothetical protein
MNSNCHQQQGMAQPQSDLSTGNCSRAVDVQKGTGTFFGGTHASEYAPEAPKNEPVPDL